MSRPTTSQIISSGDYLQPDFDAKSLTIPHLIGIFAYHQVPYPPQHNKAKLLEIFEKEIKKNGTSLLKQRLERQETLASEDGIVDGVTGAPIAPPQQPVRRSSRRVSRGASAEPTYTEPVQTKRRRASAEPAIGHGTKKASVKPAPAPAISEESEEEEEAKPEPEPLFKVGKRKESEAAGPSSRRVSRKFGPGTDDSGWEDNNIFQSGGESSSPVRPARKKATRKSNLRRNSASAPPESPTRSSPTLPDFTPSKSSFAPILSSILVKPKTRLNAIKSAEEYVDDISGLADVSAQLVVDEDEQEDDEGLIDLDEIDAEKARENARVLERSQRILAKKDAFKNKQQKPTPMLQRLAMLLVVFVVSGLAGQYKLESKPVGYCDTGLNFNKALSDVRSQRKKVESCHAEFAGSNAVNSCPPLPLVPLPHPDTCTPCPAHASCTQFSVTCDEGYVLSPHILSRIPYASVLCDGMPGFGPVAFPPKCVDDEELKKNIGRAGKWIDSLLAETRGRRLCAGVDTKKPLDGGEAELWGVDVNDLYEMYTKKFSRESEGSNDKISKSFWEAIGKLRQYGHLKEGKDSSGKTYVASDRGDMNLSCRATVSLRDSWAEWRSSVFGLVAILVLGFYGKNKITARRGEGQRVAELVQIALETLQEQEINHITDPSTNPQPYLSSLQLRDLILQDEHSIPARSRLWDKVERVVEGNTNVRTNMEELRGGEEARVWTWVGTSGLSSPKKRLSMYVGQPQSPS